MNDSIANSGPTLARASRRVRYALPVAILLVLLAAFLGYRTWVDRGAGVTPAGTARISAAELEERHGLRVHLIGVTAGGGMIDFRLKILDPDKARRFLQDPANLPRLTVAESGEALMGTEGLEDDVSWEEGGILFILFSNSGGLIHPGTPVVVEFGELRLEPILAQ